MIPSGNPTDASYSPTFNSYFNVNLAQVAARVTTEFPDPDSSDDFKDDSSDDDFEFDLSNLIPNKGEIRPVYPVFNQDLLKEFQLVGEIESKEECSRAQVQLRSLFLEDEAADQSSSAYCVWVPKEPASPGRCTKSSSTGSSGNKGKVKAWKLRDLLKRSKSDGKEGLMLLTPNNKKAETQPPAPVRRSNSGTTSPDGRSGYYGAGRSREGGRRSYLPYKQDLVGFFATSQSHRKIHLPPF